MYFSGDWTVEILGELGFQFGIDFGAEGAPGTEDLYVYDTATFVMPEKAPNRQPARDFLKTAMTPEAGVLSGRVPVVKVDESRLAPYMRTSLSHFRQARLRMRYPGGSGLRPTWQMAILEYAKDRDRRKLRQAFINAPPPL